MDPKITPKKPKSKKKLVPTFGTAIKEAANVYAYGKANSNSRTKNKYSDPVLDSLRQSLDLVDRSGTV